MQALGRRALRESFGARLGWEGFEGNVWGQAWARGFGESSGAVRPLQILCARICGVSRSPAADAAWNDAQAEPVALCRCSGHFSRRFFVAHESGRMFKMTMMMAMMMNEDDDDDGDDDREHDEMDHEHIEMTMTNMMMKMMMMMMTMLEERGV